MLTPDPTVPGALLEDAGDFIPSDDAGVLVVVGTPEWVVDDARTFNLGIRERSIDYPSGTATLVLASDEALLQDYAKLADDTTPRQYETSLRAVINYVLGVVLPGAALDASPVVDANVTAYWPLTNRIHYPSLSQVAGVTAGQNATGIDLSTNTPWQGSEFVRWDAIAAGWSSVFLVGDDDCTGGDVFTGSAYVRAAAAGRNGRAALSFTNNQGKVVRTVYGSTQELPAIPGWLRLRVTGTAPKGAIHVRFGVSGEAAAAGDAFGVDGGLLTEGDELVAWFSGTSAPAGYTVAWEDETPPGTSSRTPLIDRPIETLTWKAGVSAWEFLEPLLTGSELRLFCDELRVWRLVPSTYTVPGELPLAPARLTGAVDTVSRDAQWADGVVVRYLWEDAKRGARVKVDTAGTPGKVVVVEYQRPYPGPGAAAYILRSLQPRGRVQDVTALTDPAATPGMQTRIPLLSGGELVGRARAIGFDLATGLMDVASKDQAETP